MNTELAERAAELRSEGLLYREIANRLGYSKSYLSRLNTPGAYARGQRQGREAKRRRRGSCESCGKPTAYAGRGVPAVSRHCRSCAARINAAKKIGRGPHQEKLLRLLFERGMFFGQIRDSLGLGNGHTSVLLDRMLKHGLVERPSRGFYTLPH